MDHAETATLADRLADRLRVMVELISNSLNERVHMFEAQISNEVGICRHACNTVDSTRERASDQIRHTDGLQRINDLQRDCNGFG